MIVDDSEVFFQLKMDLCVIVDLQKVICVFCSQFYEPEALLSDPADGRIFIELLGKQNTRSLQGFLFLGLMLR